MAADASRDNNRRLLVLLQTGAVVAVVGLILVMVKILPFYSCEINVLSSLVGFWNSVRCILSSPLYICIVINSIVLLIFASSSFHRHETDTPDNIVIDEPPPLLSPPPPPPPPLETQPPSRTSEKFSKVISTPQNCIEEPLIPKPRKIKKTEHSQHDEENEDTMDATWRAITGGERQRPERKHLKKSETWDVVHEAPPPQPIITNELFDVPAAKELRKSETFNETVSIRRRCGGGRPVIRRDPSVGLDELNNQVEAFIKKFNDDMRLQRQESDQRFLDMIKRGL